MQLAVRLGIHTGLVVVGEVGAGGRQEQLALGDTPNVAARLQSLARPDTVVVSDATWRLVQGYFASHDLGPQPEGGRAPVQAYRMLGPSGAQNRLDIASPRGLTPLVGRETEVALLHERWAQAARTVWARWCCSAGKRALASRAWSGHEGAVIGQVPHRWECRCSPYFQDSALFPVIDHVQRVAALGRDESPAARLQKQSRRRWQHYSLAQPDTVALLPPCCPSRRPIVLPSQSDPQRQRQKTLEAVVALLLARGHRAAGAVALSRYALDRSLHTGASHPALTRGPRPVCSPCSPAGRSFTPPGASAPT